MVRRVQWQLDSDDDMYDDLYNESSADAPDWWQANEQTTFNADHADHADNQAAPFMQSLASNTSTRHRMIQRYYQNNVLPVSKSNQKRLTTPRASATSHNEFAQEDAQEDTQQAASSLQALEEDSDDPMSGWALGPGV